MNSINQKYIVDSGLCTIKSPKLETKSDWAILNLDHKFGAKKLFKLRWGIQAGLEISAINPENYAKEDLISSSYQVEKANIKDLVFNFYMNNSDRVNKQSNEPLFFAYSYSKLLSKSKSKTIYKFRSTFARVRVIRVTEF